LFTFLKSKYTYSLEGETVDVRANELKIRFDPSNYQKITRLRNIHKDEQCVVMLTGPSLNQMDCSLLKEHPFVLGVNGAFIKRNNFRYFFCSSPNFYLKNRDAIGNIDTDQFVFSSLIPFKKSRKSVYILLDRKAVFTRTPMKKFRPNLLFKVSWGPTVLLDLVIPSCLWMGFSEIILLGADYTIKNFGHFYDNTNSEIQHSIQIDHEQEVRLAHHGFDTLLRYLKRTKKSIKIYNCSLQSSLDHFQKRRLEDIIR